MFCKKRCSLKFRKIHRKTSVPEFLFWTPPDDSFCTFYIFYTFTIILLMLFILIKNLCYFVYFNVKHFLPNLLWHGVKPQVISSNFKKAKNWESLVEKPMVKKWNTWWINCNCVVPGAVLATCKQNVCVIDYNYNVYSLMTSGVA